MTAATPTARRAWTLEEVQALGLRTDLVTACQIAYGIGKNKAWEMYHAGELDFPAIKVGRRVVCPTRPLLQLLGAGSA
ncbi:DNA-binding protein [Dactylosporangium sp. NPDC051484]|uniref:DNA-binding protein n=1 Tax=Dactylosporangium sp. NPDC051484 TaxID=3154942 RepID=UPI003450081F